MSQINSLINSFKDIISDFLFSGNYNITEELAAEVRSIESDLDKIKLDNNFLDSSQVWSQVWSEITNEQNGAIGLINQGISLMKDIKSSLKRHSQGNITDDQIRRDQFNSKSKLKEFKENLNPYSYGADARLDNFSHYVGASNRLSYYRKNLTKDNSIGDHRWVDRIERKNVDTSQFERKNIEAPRQEKQDTHNYNENTTPLRPYTSYIKTRENSDNSIGPKTANEIADVVFRKNHHLRRLQSAATNPNKKKEYSNLTDKQLIDRGIFAAYPDRSEYSYIYTKPKESEYISSFTINPQPNMKIFGRPFATAVPEIRLTEYQTKFQVPDGSKLERLPWLKK